MSNHEVLVVLELILKLVNLLVAFVFFKLFSGKTSFINRLIKLTNMTLDLDFIALSLQMVDHLSISHGEAGTFLFAEASVLLGGTFIRHLVGFHLALAEHFAC